MRQRNIHEGLVVFLVKLMQRGYTRSIPGLYRFLKKRNMVAVEPPNSKYSPKPYEQMLYLSQRAQVDAKHVPYACIVGDAKGQMLYQYAAIDKYSRFRYVEAFNEASTYTSAAFVKNLVKAFKFNVECIQTDNGLSLPIVLVVIKTNQLYLKKLLLN